MFLLYIYIYIYIYICKSKQVNKQDCQIQLIVVVNIFFVMISYVLSYDFFLVTRLYNQTILKYYDVLLISIIDQEYKSVWTGIAFSLPLR